MKTLWKRSYTAVLFCGTSLIAAMPASLPAQSSSQAAAPQANAITGRVVDAHGRVIQYAVVAVRNDAMHRATEATADDQGHFVVANLSAGSYSVTISAPGFAPQVLTGVAVIDGQSQTISAQLKIGSFAQNVEVQDIAGNSLAAQHALSQSKLDAVAPKSEITSTFIREFTPETADYSEIVQIAPGTFSYNPNGIGLGQGTIYFRGFPDGDYDITWDGIPFEDTNTPSHHSWAFFPGLWVGSIDFDRSPGIASTIGPSTFGGSINMFSKNVPEEQSIEPMVSYGSFNTLLVDGQYNTGFFGPNKKIGMTLDVHHMSSDGYQTFNRQQRDAGDIKVIYRLSDRTVLTGYSGVIDLATNTPNNDPTRAQITAHGWNYLLQNTDPTSAYYYKYNYYHVPTDFEYVGVKSQLGRGWLVDVKPYTYSYYNAQRYANDNPNDTTGLGSTGWIEDPNCSTQIKKKSYYYLPCGVDKLNSYRKYGETSTVSQTSKYGVFRTGLWYEWAKTNRYQIPSDPLTGQDETLPNFHERFWTNSYNPFVEYEWHATKKLTLIGGYKYAYYNMQLQQYADNGKTVGSLDGAAWVISSGGFGSHLPSASANYRLATNWSVYGQFSKGAEIPPSSTFDLTGGGVNVSQLPKPTETTAYQAGTVLKLNRVTLDADYYHVKFQNNYIAYADQDNADLDNYYLGPDSVTQGFEAEANASLGYGLHVYANGTVNKATYTGSGVPSDLYVAYTPGYTQSLAFTYQDHGLDLGIIEKRVGDHYDDNGSYHNQVWIAPSNNANLFLNYTFRSRHSIFNDSKVRFSINNLFNDKSILDVSPNNSAVAVNSSSWYATTAQGPLDQLKLTSARSYMVSFKVGIFPNHHNK